MICPNCKYVFVPVPMPVGVSWREYCPRCQNVYERRYANWHDIRPYRWRAKRLKELVSEVESRYGLPRGILAAKTDDDCWEQTPTPEQVEHFLANAHLLRGYDVARALAWRGGGR